MKSYFTSSGPVWILVALSALDFKFLMILVYLEFNLLEIESGKFMNLLRSQGTNRVTNIQTGPNIKYDDRIVSKEDLFQL